jgi:Tfp pilus assembly protein PilW
MLVKKTRKQEGVTLVEMIVAISIFVFVIVIVTSIFQLVIEGQRNAIAAQNTQESLRFTLEMMSKELRQARVSNTQSSSYCQDVLTAPIYRTFNKDNTTFPGFDILYFKNKHEECVYYTVVDDGGINRLGVIRFDPATDS